MDYFTRLKEDYFSRKLLSQKIVVSNEYFMILEEKLINRKTPIFHIYNSKSKDEIGEIKWYGAWRKYCFFPNHDTIWDSKCLNNINNFLEEINTLKKEQDCKRSDKND